MAELRISSNGGFEVVEDEIAQPCVVEVPMIPNGPGPHRVNGIVVVVDRGMDDARLAAQQEAVRAS